MSYHSTDVMAYVYDGQVYCNHCIDYIDIELDENWGVVFADEFFDSDMEGNCCGDCGHNLACSHKISGDMWENCPGCNH
jgi:hypothetical protein